MCSAEKWPSGFRGGPILSLLLLLLRSPRAKVTRYFLRQVNGFLHHSSNEPKRQWRTRESDSRLPRRSWVRSRLGPIVFSFLSGLRCSHEARHLRCLVIAEKCWWEFLLYPSRATKWPKWLMYPSLVPSPGWLAVFLSSHLTVWVLNIIFANYFAPFRPRCRGSHWTTWRCSRHCSVSFPTCEVTWLWRHRRRRRRPWCFSTRTVDLWTRWRKKSFASSFSVSVKTRISLE